MGWLEMAGVATGVAVPVLGAVMGIVRAIVSPYKQQLEEHSTEHKKSGARLDVLERTTATRQDLKDTETTVINALREVAGDIKAEIRVVDQKAGAAHERLDRAQQDEINRLRAAVKP